MQQLSLYFRTHFYNNKFHLLHFYYLYILSLWLFFLHLCMRSRYFYTYDKEKCVTLSSCIHPNEKLNWQEEMCLYISAFINYLTFSLSLWSSSLPSKLFAYAILLLMLVGINKVTNFSKSFKKLKFEWKLNILGR